MLALLQVCLALGVMTAMLTTIVPFLMTVITSVNFRGDAMALMPGFPLAIRFNLEQAAPCPNPDMP